MNKRLRELMKQADYPAPEIALRAQKLAELIIRKCRDIVGKTRDQAIKDEWNIEEAMSTAMFDIEEHFGVEE